MRGNSVAIFAGLDERIFSGKPESDYIASQMAIPAAALAFYADLPDGEIFFKTDKSLALISIDSGKWKKFNAVKLSGDIISDARALAKCRRVLPSRIQYPFAPFHPLYAQTGKKSALNWNF